VKLETRNRKPTISPARTAAFDILVRVEREASYASELLHATAYAQLPQLDHGLATELVMGVLRWRSVLDAEISGHSQQPLGKLDLEVLTALRLGLYQLRHLDRIPTHAAIHESVELVKRSRKRSAAPFVNAVLRKLASAAPRPGDALAEPEAVAASALAQSYAHPLWLVERWVNSFGPAITQKICLYDQSPPLTTLRLRNPNDEVMLRSEMGRGVTLDAGALLSSARRLRSSEVARLHVLATTHLAIQDEGSQLVAALVGTGARILDCCAAPGGKTQAIADHNPNVTVVAVEIHPHRARLLRRLVLAKNVHVIAADIRDLALSLKFDCILADVPCSGTGTLARNPEIKWRLKPADLTDLQARQIAILRAALAHAAPRGRVIYSTCSLEEEENEAVVDAVLTADPFIRLLDCRVELERLKSEKQLIWPDLASLTYGPCLRTLPGVHPCDGFFAAVLEKQ